MEEMPEMARENIRSQFIARQSELISRMVSITGHTYSFNIDWNKLYLRTPANNPLKNQLGTALYDYFSAFCTNVGQVFASNEKARQRFIAVTHMRQLKATLFSGGDNFWYHTNLRGGFLWLIIPATSVGKKRETFGSNIIMVM